MNIFSWKDSLSVNVREIDNEHKQLVDTLNALYVAMNERRAKGAIGEILNRLAEYTITHFKNEEKLMTRRSFPGYNEHHEEHEAFKAKVADFMAGYKSGKIMLSLEVMNFLKDWLNNHILGQDKEYGRFLNEQGIF